MKNTVATWTFAWDFIVLATTVPFSSIGLILTDVPLPSDLP